MPISGGHIWPQADLSKDWHDWGWKLFHEAAFVTAPWPVLYDSYSPGALAFDRMSVPEWIDANVPGGVKSDFGALCVSAVLDEFGGDPDEQSALNLVYLLGQDDSTGNSFQPRGTPALGGVDEKWHIHGGTDLLITGLLDRLPAGSVNYGQQLVALRTSSTGGFLCTFQSGATTQDVTADHVVLTLPFTTLRQVDLSGVSKTIPALQMRAINEEPLGTNSKFFAQFTSRVWNTEHATGNAYCDGVVQGAWEPTIYQAGEAGILAALPGGRVGSDWGTTYGLTNYFGQPPASMLTAHYPGRVRGAVPGHHRRLQRPVLLRLVGRRSPRPRCLLLSEGGPVHGLQRDPGSARREPPLRRRAHLGQLPGLCRRRPPQWLQVCQRGRGQDLSRSRFQLGDDTKSFSPGLSHGYSGRAPTCSTCDLASPN